MTTDAVLKNINQIKNYLIEKGHQVSYGKIKADLDKGAIPKRRGGGFTTQSVDQYAAGFLAKRVDESSEADRPLGDTNGGAAESRTLADAELKQVQAARAKFNFEKEMGRHVETATMETELGERAKAFRLGLEKWGLDNGENVAAIFGGEDKSASELLTSLELPDTPENIRQVVDFALSRLDRWGRLWRKHMEDFLDAYATGAWWTDEMQEVWERYEENKGVTCDQ